MTEEIQLSTREEQARRLTETLRRQLGSTLCGLMQAPDVVELMLNSDGRVWVDRLGRGMEPVCNMVPATAESLIATVASTIRSTVTRESPILECELPLVSPFNGARFEAVIPPNVSPGPVFTIRRKASSVFTLDQYVTTGVMTALQCAAIKRAVGERQNILVVGGTGTGKTTLTNAILAYMAEVATAHRLVIIEDTSEIQCAAENAVILRATDTVYDAAAAENHHAASAGSYHRGRGPGRRGPGSPEGMEHGPPRWGLHCPREHSRQRCTRGADPDRAIDPGGQQFPHARADRRSCGSDRVHCQGGQ